MLSFSLTMIDVVVRRIRSHEGYVRFPYRCSAGKLTVGYGRNLDDYGIDPQEAEFLLTRDVDRALSLAQGLPYFPSLDPVRQGVVVELIFWLGWAGFKKFVRFSRYMGKGDYRKAAKELLDSRAAEQAPARMRALAALLVSLLLLLFCPATAAPFSLSWQDNASNESGYEIERADGQSSALQFSVVGKVGENVSRFTDDKADVSRVTCYRVRAFREAHGTRIFSAYSNTACGVRISAPASLQIFLEVGQ